MGVLNAIRYLRKLLRHALPSPFFSRDGMNANALGVTMGLLALFELTTLLGVKAHVNLYNEPQDETVKRACDESSVLLWRIVRA
jgi:hypothetical protein